MADGLPNLAQMTRAAISAAPGRCGPEVLAGPRSGSSMRAAGRGPHSRARGALLREARRLGRPARFRIHQVHARKRRAFREGRSSRDPQGIGGRRATASALRFFARACGVRPRRTRWLVVRKGFGNNGAHSRNNRPIRISPNGRHVATQKQKARPGATSIIFRQGIL